MDEGIMTMKKGELGRLYIEPHKGYGSKGFPAFKYPLTAPGFIIRSNRLCLFFFIIKALVINASIILRGAFKIRMCGTTCNGLLLPVVMGAGHVLCNSSISSLMLSIFSWVSSWFFCFLTPAYLASTWWILPDYNTWPYHLSRFCLRKVITVYDEFRPAKSHGISVSLQKWSMISRSHGIVTKSHGI